MSINNFKRLEEQESRGQQSPPPIIERNVRGNVGIFHLIGNIVELYLPRVFDMFITISGGPENGSLENGPNHNGPSNQHRADDDFSEGDASTDHNFR